MRDAGQSRGALRALAVVTLLITMACGFASGPNVIVRYRGHVLHFGPGIRPFQSQRTIMIPVRQTASAVGVKMAWNAQTKHVVLSYGKDKVDYLPGHHSYQLNGIRRNMRATSQARRGHLFVPIRLFSDLTLGRVRGLID